MAPLALGMLRRELRAGEMRVLVLAIALAVASLTAVSFFSDRLALALARQANALLAADLAVGSDHPLAPEFQAEARRRGLTVSASAAFLSMARHGDRPLLVGIKAVQAGYPLRGRLRIAAAPYAPDAPTSVLPGPGQAWLDPRAAAGLGAGVGDTVELGQARFRVTAILTFEGERGGNFLALAPRVLIREADLAATGLVQEGSRVTWRLLLAGEPAALAAWRAWAGARLKAGEKLEEARDARPELRQTLDKAQRYLGLANLLTVALAAAAAHLALRRYVQRHLDQYALLRCFGASHRQLFGLYLTQLAGLGLLAGALGSGLGWLVQRGLGRLVEEVLRLPLPAPSWQPLGLGLAAGLVLILAFALPPLLRLAQVPVLRVLRRDVGTNPGPGYAAGCARTAHALSLALVAGLILGQAGDAQLAALAGAGTAALLLAAAGLTRALLPLVRRLARPLPPGPRLGLLSLTRRAGDTSLQVMALSLGLLALLLLTLVRSDLLEAWRNQIPPGAPNRFVINIQPEQAEPVADWLRARGVTEARLYPMVRARLTAIAGRTVRPEDYPEGRARRLAEREFNLSELAQLPPDNRLTAGRWWLPNQAQGFTVEAELAETLGIRLGDRLDFDAGGLPLSGQVESLRKVEWDSFRPNFFVATPPAALDGLPRSFITAFHLPTAQGAVLADLVQAFPNLTVIDVAQVMAELQLMTEQLGLAVQGVFAFSLGTGVLVMLAALYARRQERAREIGLWRALGASRATLRAALASEWALLGALVGLVASVAASLLAWVLARQVFDLPHQPDPLIWLVGVGGGMVLTLCAGWLATRGLLRASPLAALRAG